MSEWLTGFRNLFATLARIERKIDQMAVDQATFDGDLAPFLTAVTTFETAASAYFTAAQAALANVPGVDLTAEANQIATAQAALAAVVIPAAPGVTAPVVVTSPPITPAS
jgi:hypothetical protein